jgi:hypothetical protein
MKIQEILTSCEKQIEHQRSQQLRATELLSLLKVTRENYNKSNPAKKSFTAIEMSDNMDKNEIMHELNYAIILLSDYQKTQLLSIAKPSQAFTQEFADKLNSIKDSIEAILNKYQTD